MKTATLEQLNKLMPDNILSYPIYQRVIQLFRKTFSSSGIENRIASPKPFNLIDLDHVIRDSAMSLSQIEARNILEVEEKNRTAGQKTGRIVQAMVTTIPVMGDTEEESPLDTLGILLSIARRESNLTIEQLALMTNIDIESLFLIENGLASMDLVADNLENICNSIGLDYHKTSSYIIDLILR